MTEFLQQALLNTSYAIFIVVFFGLSIFVHELGHLLVALWRGMHVDRFSIGFGKPIWSRRWRGVEYVVGWLPFGGYVALPQMDPGDRAQAGDGVPIPHAKPTDRILVALAGPACNVVFAAAMAAIIWWVGIKVPEPQPFFVVGEVPETYVLDGAEVPTPEYAAGLRVGDVVTAINGEPIKDGWADARKRFLFASGEVVVDYRRGEEERQARFEMVPNPEVEGLFFPFLLPKYPAAIRSITPDSPAAASGLRVGDVLLAVNGSKIDGFPQLVEMVRASEGKPLDITVERTDPAGSAEAREETFAVVPKKFLYAGEVVYQIGVTTSPPMVRVHPTPVAQVTEFFTDMLMMFKGLADRGNPISVGHMSSVVGIVHSLWSVLSLDGLIAGLKFMVLINVNLAVVNMLPVPVLDGGHISFAVLESITRRRVPSRVADVLQAVCAILLIGLILYVTYNDGRRVSRDLKRPKPAAAPQPVAPDTELGPQNELGDKE